MRASLGSVRRFAWPTGLVCCLLACLAPSCSTAPPAEGPLGIAVRWGLGEPSVLPSTVDSVVIYICYADEAQCERNTCSVAGLTGMTESTCRPAEGTEDYGESPVLVRRELRTDVPVSFTLIGADEAGAYRFIGQAGPFVLGQGQRRQVELFMYPIGSAEAVDEPSAGRLMPTTSLLPDGRVLIAGGFDSATETECPPERMLPMDTRCYDLRATDEALAVDVTTRTVTPIRNRMLEARGGHTATTLPDGRVLIAGGAERALIAFAPEGDISSGRFRVLLFPQLADGADGAHESFELFDAYLDGEPEDPERDGDPGRGGFFGTTGTASPGALNAPRFLHAAAAIPDSPERVVLAGGMGGGEASYEVFDADKAGGFGVHQGGGALSVPRPMPGAVGIGDSVWIFGGRFAEDNSQLAEIWQPGDTGDPNGETVVASDVNEFPNVSAGMMQDEPRFSLLAPTVVAVDEGQRPFAVGWYGRLCAPMSDMPAFAGAGSELCNSPGPGMRSSFTVSPTGVTTPTEARPRAFGAAAYLWARPDARPDSQLLPGPTGEVAFTGGVANVAFSGQASVEVYTGRVSTNGEAVSASALSVSLEDQRFFHDSTGVPGGGIVTAGGASFDTLRGMTLTESVEIVFVPAP